VIVVDDSSTDSTVEIVKRFKDHRLKLLVNERNLGTSATRNRGNLAASGRWIAVLDGDDWFAPERLEKLLPIACATNADLIADDLHLIRDGEAAPWSTLIDESGEAITTIRQIDPIYFVETDVFGQQGLHLGLTKPLFRKDFLLKNQIEYNVNSRVTEDFWLTLECLVRGAKFILVPEPYYFYRGRPDSIMHSPPLRRLQYDCDLTVSFIRQKELDQKQPALAGALRQNLAIMQKNLAYYQVVDPLKHRQWLRSFIQMLLHPYFFLHLATRLPEIVERRVRYYLFGNKLAFYMLYFNRNKKRQKRMAASSNDLVL
jgi:succinoglycan biosynthesis protein ExoO